MHTVDMRNFVTKIFCINSLFVNFVLVCFLKINETTKNISDAKFLRLVSGTFKITESLFNRKKLYYGEYIARVPNLGIYQYCIFNK